MLHTRFRLDMDIVGPCSWGACMILLGHVGGARVGMQGRANKKNRTRRTRAEQRALTNALPEDQLEVVSCYPR